jgi:hypothetical protein
MGGDGLGGCRVGRGGRWLTLWPSCISQFGVATPMSREHAEGSRHSLWKNADFDYFDDHGQRNTVHNEENWHTSSQKVPRFNDEVGNGCGDRCSFVWAPQNKPEKRIPHLLKLVI